MKKTKAKVSLYEAMQVGFIICEQAGIKIIKGYSLAYTTENKIFSACPVVAALVGLGYDFDAVIPKSPILDTAETIFGNKIRDVVSKVDNLKGNVKATDIKKAALKEALN